MSMILEDAVYATTVAVFGKSEAQQYGFAVMEKLLMGGLAPSDLIDLITDVAEKWDGEHTDKIRLYADVVQSLVAMNAEVDVYKSFSKHREAQNAQTR